MTGRMRKYGFLAGTFALWLFVIGMIVHIHYVRKIDPELEYFAPDIRFESGGRTYYSLTKDGRKVGYRSETTIRNDIGTICWENSVVKLNLAGMSREVFLQCAVSVDSTKVFSRSMDFTIQSGTHFYNCKGFLSNDSLFIDVKKNAQDLWRKGLYIVDENTTYPTAVPFYIHRAVADTMTIHVFDPVIFLNYVVTSVRQGQETLTAEGKRVSAVRYDLSFLDRSAALWLDMDGIPVRSEGAVFFSGELGDMTAERSNNRNVLMLPLEVSLGNDILKSAVLTPDRSIDEPRRCQYLEIELDGIRAGNIETQTSNRRFLSSDPVVFGIQHMPLLAVSGFNRAAERMALSDTSLVGTSDYIQSKDARIARTARQIVEAEADTLEMARRIGRWVHTSMKTAEGIAIARSIDVFRDRRGTSEEYTKLFTALSRSIGIPTQIVAGLVYTDGAFRYHSWPSVYADGTWNDIDPFFGQDRADATHVSLINGDYDALIELLRVIGRMSVKVLDYR